ncbi:MAG TPA: hypothetical protein DCL40_03405 [Coxiellaceae bacterium]|nr:hypothetical protein [Coxiellaceae bacterium]|tara:strand:+ start:923 stop:1510 length:588 start_codon:yes stop_codon:yes gene_type:complete
MRVRRTKKTSKNNETLIDIRDQMIKVIEESMRQLLIPERAPELQNKISQLTNIGQTYISALNKIHPDTFKDVELFHNMTKKIKHYENEVKAIISEPPQTEAQQELSNIMTARVQQLQTRTDSTSHASKKLIQQGIQLNREIRELPTLSRDNSLQQRAYQAVNRYCFLVDERINSQPPAKSSQLPSKTGETRIACR